MLRAPSISMTPCILSALLVVAQELLESQAVINDEDRDAFKTSKANPAVGMKELIDHVYNSYNTKVDEIKRECAQKQSSKAPTGLAAFEFLNESNNWQPITDATIVGELTKLMTKQSAKVTYSFGGNSYEACLTNSSAGNHEIDQTNPNYSTCRPIRDPKLHQGQSHAHSDICGSKMNDLLFGESSPVELTDEFLDKLLNELRFKTPASEEMYMPLADLATLFSSIGSKASNFKYSVPKGTTPTSKAAKHYTSHSENGFDFNSAMWIKPIQLFQWLTLAKSRGYRHCRIIVHGASTEAYEKMRDDPFGFDMRFAGKNGQAYGNGLYFGLSDHATVGYNAHSNYPNGTCLMGLLLTDPKIGWQHHHHGGYTKMEDKSETYMSYHTMMFGATPVSGVDNAIVVHDPALTLPLGLCHAFDPKDGWERKKRY